MTSTALPIFGLLTAALLLISGCAAPTPQSRFAREQRRLVRYEGSTREGSSLAVYLNNHGQVRHLDWTQETSRQLIHRQYYFEQGQETPSSVTETTYATMRGDNPYLANARQTSRTEHRLYGRGANARARDFLEHSRFLIKEFRSHRKDYLASGPAAPH